MNFLAVVLDNDTIGSLAIRHIVSVVQHPDREDVCLISTTNSDQPFMVMRNYHDIMLEIKGEAVKLGP